MPSNRHRSVPWSAFLLLLFCLLLPADSLLAATGDPLPGVDILVKKKPPDRKTRLSFGGPDVAELPAGFFGPGSDPFTGEVPLTLSLIHISEPTRPY